MASYRSAMPIPLCKVQLHRCCAACELPCILLGERQRRHHTLRLAHQFLRLMRWQQLQNIIQARSSLYSQSPYASLHQHAPHPEIRRLPPLRLTHAPPRARSGPSSVSSAISATTSSYAVRISGPGDHIPLLTTELVTAQRTWKTNSTKRAL
jgi:hypothetical protein